MIETAVAVAPMTEFDEAKQPRRITYILVMGKSHHYRTHFQASTDRAAILKATGQSPKIVRSLNVSKQEVPHFQPAPEMLNLLRRCQKFLCHPKEGDRLDLLADVTAIINEATRAPPVGAHGSVEI